MNMNKKILIGLIVGAVIIAVGVLAILSLRKEKPIVEQKKMYKIGVLQTAVSLEPAYAGFKETMEKLGYKEGENIFYDYFDTKGDLAVSKREAERFIKEGFDMIYAIGVMPAKAAKEVTSGMSLPVVFSVVSDPVGTGIVKSLESSGSNIAGVTPANQEASAKRVEFLKEVIPGLKRIILPYNDPKTTGIENVKKTAQILGIEVVDKYVANVEELDSFLAGFEFQKNDGFLRAADSVLANRVAKIIELTKKNKIPLSGTHVADAKAGALMSYGANYGLLGKQAAVIADKIFKGVKPASLPIELPEKFDLAVNQKTAELIGAQFTPEFLAKADLIIE